MALSRYAVREWLVSTVGRLDPGAWARLEALPDPRSPQGRIYSLASLVTVALCGMTVAGHDRLTGIGQWIKRADPVDRARFALPWDPMAGAYRVPDEKTIRTLLDRLDPLALTRALLVRADAGAPPARMVRRAVSVTTRLGGVRRRRKP